MTAQLQNTLECGFCDLILFDDITKDFFVTLHDVLLRLCLFRLQLHTEVVLFLLYLMIQQWINVQRQAELHDLWSLQCYTAEVFFFFFNSQRNTVLLFYTFIYINMQLHSGVSSLSLWYDSFLLAVKWRQTCFQMVGVNLNRFPAVEMRGKTDVVSHKY